MPRIARLTAEEFEGLLEQAQRTHTIQDEPIPALGPDSRAKVNACLAAPFQTFGGRDLHPAIMAKSAALFYGIAKGHPLGNGNKRMAILALGYFLYKNGYILELSDPELEDLAMTVAQSTDHAQAIADIKFRIRLGRRSRR